MSTDCIIRSDNGNELIITGLLKVLASQGNRIIMHNVNAGERK